jgi:hypothetical protein
MTKVRLANTQASPPVTRQEDFDYARTSSGHVRNWSREYKAPFLPALTAYIDPRGIGVYDTIACTFTVDGVVLTQAFVVGPGDNAVTALYWIAKAIDENIPHLHAFSEEYMIGLQVEQGHEGALLSLASVPFQETPGPSGVYEYPARAFDGATHLIFDIMVGGEGRLFRVPSTGSPTQDVKALSDLMNLNPWLVSGLRPDRFVVTLRPQSGITLGTLRYG